MTATKTNLTYSESKLLSLLLNFSVSKPVSSEAVLSYLDISARAFRRICLSLRNKGYKICFSLNNGYYIAENEEDYLRFRDSYTEYSRTIYNATKAMDKSELYKEDIKRLLLSGKAVDTNEKI